MSWAQADPGMTQIQVQNGGGRKKVTHEWAETSLRMEEPLWARRGAPAGVRQPKV